MSTSNQTFTIRPGTVADSYAVFMVFEETLADLLRRMGITELTSLADPAALAKIWVEFRPLFEHLAQTAAHFYVAEQNGEVVGFARTILRDDVQELTEFFVRPQAQSGGIGRELLARAFPNTRARHKLIVATGDVRALSRYFKAGVYPRFSFGYFWRASQVTTVESDLTFEPMAPTAETLVILGNIDQAILDYRRNEDHLWLLSDRQGYLYQRRGEAVGYGYVGQRSGPFALLDNADFPAVLAHAENEAVRRGVEEFGLEVPLINQAAVDYLLARQFRLDTFIAHFMSDAPFGQFDHYIAISPPFIL